MSGKGQFGGKGGKSSFVKGAKKTSGKSANKRAGLTFPVSRVGRYLKKGRFADRIAGSAPTFLAAILEYLVAELLEISGNTARDCKKNRILPRHLKLAIESDDELARLLGDVTIAGAGVVPGINAALSKQEKKEKKKQKKEAERAALENL